MNFIPIRLATFRPDATIPFDLFIFYEGRYLHYRKPKDVIEAALIVKMKKKGIKKLFIKPEHENLYLTYLEAALDDLSESSIPVAQRSDMAKSTMLMEAENVEKNLDSEESYNRTQSRINKVAQFLIKEKTAIENILASAGASMDNTEHSANVSTLALSIAGEAGITDQQELFSLGLAALLHDIGKVKLEIDPLIPREKLPKEQRSKYWKHPEVAVEMLSGKKYITPRVLKLIHEHEEVGEGTGFPEKKWIKRLSEAGQVLNIANNFDHLCMVTKVTPMACVEGWMANYAKLFIPKHVEILQKILAKKVAS